MASAHTWSQNVLVSASLRATYELLRNVQNFEQMTSTVTGLTMLSQDEFAGRGKPLFLRDVISFKVSSCKAPEHVAVTMDDGHNVVQYTFLLEEMGPACTAVHCDVDCRTRLGDEWSGPSERLAKLMQRQDRHLVQRLKGYVEAASHTVPVC